MVRAKCDQVSHIIAVRSYGESGEITEIESAQACALVADLIYGDYLLTEGPQSEHPYINWSYEKYQLEHSRASDAVFAEEALERVLLHTSIADPLNYRFR